MRAITIICALLLTSCAQHKIEAQVREVLKDSDSAKFGDITVSEDGTTACGTVNSKNGFGGYTGDTFFMLYDGDVRFPDKDNEFIPLADCCYAALGRAAGRAEIDEEAKRKLDGCWKLSPRIVLRLPNQS